MTESAELVVPKEVAEIIGAMALAQSVEMLEAQLLASPLELPGKHSSAWREFAAMVHATWRRRDHVILRGLPVTFDGNTCAITACLFGRAFKTYRGSRIVKHFRMSPWTTDLSQTTRDGHFHTDLNTASTPPRTTLIQCLVPDPAAPEMGQVRVARLEDLLGSLAASEASETLDFIRNVPVQVVDDRAAGSWTGTIVEAGQIRFHPQTLRAAVARFGTSHPDIEVHLDVIRKHAFAVSTPISLGVGDALAVSNTQALHYRGPCTARFIEFPRVFESREIFVLHLHDEPSLQP